MCVHVSMRSCPRSGRGRTEEILGIFSNGQGTKSSSYSIFRELKLQFCYNIFINQVYAYLLEIYLCARPVASNPNNNNDDDDDDD